MELTFQKWIPTLLALQKRFNESKDVVQQFAALTAIQSEFETNAKWITEECNRYRKFAVDEMTGKK